MCKNIIITVVLAVLLASCSETKYVAEGEYLLDRLTVKSDVKSKLIVPSEMRMLVRQKGNSRWFNAIKLPLRTYSLSGRDSTKWINRTLRSMGEPPVIYDSLLTQQSVRDLRLQMQNKGYLRADVEVENKRKGKKIRTTYKLHPGNPYYIRLVRYDIRDSAIAQLIKADDPKSRGLRLGMMFNVENLDAERKRITELLANNGY